MINTLKKLSRNKIFYFFLALILIMFPQTIYMQSDNNTKLVVTTIGIDKSESGDGYSLSALAVIPKASTDVSANLELFEGEGKTISEALSNISLNTGKQVGLAHCDCIILSLDVLKENISSVLDYFIRTSNLTTNAALLSTDQEAKKLVEASKSSNNFLDLTLKDIVTYEELTTLLENTTIEEFDRSHFGKSSTFFLPILEVEQDEGGNSNSSQGSSDSESSNNSSQNSSGKIQNKTDIAVLSQGKFVRRLTDDEKFIYNLLSKSSQYQNIEIKNINDEYVNDSLEIYQQVAKLSLPIYKFVDGKPVVSYEIWINIMLEEINSANNFSFASIDSLQNFLSSTAESEILKVIDQKRISTVETMHSEKNDILNLYKKFNAYKHREWKEYLNTLENQEDYLTQVDIQINTHLSYVI